MTASVQEPLRQLEGWIPDMLLVAREELCEDCDKWVGMPDSSLTAWMPEKFVDVDAKLAAAGAAVVRQKTAFLVRAMSWVRSSNNMVLEFGNVRGKAGADAIPEQLLRAVAEFQMLHKTPWKPNGTNYFTLPLPTFRFPLNRVSGSGQRLPGHCWPPLACCLYGRAFSPVSVRANLIGTRAVMSGRFSWPGPAQNQRARFNPG